MMAASRILLPSSQHNLKVHIVGWLLVVLLQLNDLPAIHQSSASSFLTLNRGEYQHRQQDTALRQPPALVDNHNDSSTISKLNPLHGPRIKRRLKSSKLPEFSAPIGNVTAVMGRDVRLMCTVENLGQYQVAWLKEESKTILSIDTNIIITNYRIFLIPDEEERKWVLHIKDVQESDRGFYQCQVNTNPMRSTSGYLEVVVPPTIIESQSTRVAELVEHSDVGLQCKANGHPRPTITWRRDDGSPIRLNGGSISDQPPANQSPSLASHSFVAGFGLTIAEPSLQQTSLSQLIDVKSDKLSMRSVDRFMAGIYVCTASNGIPTQVSKRIPLYVKFPPKTSVQNKHISVSLGDELEIDCIIEAFPKANSYWSKKSLSSLQDDRGHWADGARWLHGLTGNVGRAPFYRAKHILGPTEGSAETTNPLDEASSSIIRDTKIREEGQQSTLEQSSASNSSERAPTKQQGLGETDMMTVDRKDLMSSFGGNFRSSQPIIYSSNQQQSRLPGPDQTSSTPSPLTAAVAASSSSSSSSSSKAYVTVRQTPLNTFTYKLRLSIARMQPDDYGEYTCVSTNSMGSSESKVMVTKADKISETSDRQAGSDYRSLGEDDYERDSIADQARPTLSNHPTTNNQQQQQSSVRRVSPHGGNRAVYDGNYLQAIKMRQSNLLGPNRLQQQQNLKLRQFSERSSARSANSIRLGDSSWQISVIVSLTLTMLAISLSSHLVEKTRATF